MTNAIQTPPARTEAEVMQEIAETTVKLAMLDLELKRLRNPNGLSFADLKGILAGANIDTDEIAAARARSQTEVEAGV